MSQKLCHCGQPLHYSDPDIQKKVESIVEALGEFIEVQSTAGGPTYRVQRHYIALHGITGSEIESLGFERVG